MKKIINLLFCFMLLGCTKNNAGPIRNLEDPIAYMLALNSKDVVIEEFDENIYRIKQDSGLSFINFNTFEYIDVGEIFNWKELAINDWGYIIGCKLYYDEIDGTVNTENCLDNYAKNYQIQYMSSIVLHLLTKDYDLDKDVINPSFANEYDYLDIKDIKPYLSQINEYIEKNYELNPLKTSDEALQNMKEYYCTEDSLAKGRCKIG